MKNNILELKDVTAGYGSKEVLKNISFFVKEGSFTGIIGPNGSGKSTLVKTLGNFLKPDRGIIYYRETDVRNITHKEYAKKITVVPQETKTVFDYTVRDFVTMGRYPYTGFWGTLSKEDTKEIEEVLFTTGLNKCCAKNINEMSGGEKQMVFLARALCQKTSLIVLDEPLTFLDIKHQKIIIHILEKFNKEKALTVLMVVHDINTVLKHCTDTIILNEGSVYASGNTEATVNKETIREIFETEVEFVKCGDKNLFF
ncbi:MAG: ABC transporter ATP-binding protein [Candidatus Aureabacteria bacterium]|nr:ABC transporter ATP-binding protein [Candidatus Auribacterota bacterium]